MIDEKRADENMTTSRLREAMSGALQKLHDRAVVLAAALVMTMVFVAAGGLSARGAAWGAGALFLWSAVWPNARTSAGNIELRRTLADAAVSSRRPVWMSIIGNLPDAAIALDSNGMVLAVNRALLELFPGALSGQHISQVTRAPELLTSVETALETRQPQSCRLDFKVPVERSLVGTVAPLETTQTSEQAPSLLIVLTDLTEQDRLVRMRADFVANASHELRTPLASLKGFVETLQGAAKDDDVARDKFLKIMQQQADRMARLIDDLLSLSRIEMQAHVMPRDSVDLGNVIAHVVQTLGPIADERSVAIDVVSSAVPPVVMGDRDELIQVFQNLIENAIKYGRQGGRVAVREDVIKSVSGIDRICVSVADDGPGIAPKHLPRLTERFYRVNAAQSRNAGGTGLGLAIVKHVLNRHQADLQVDSTVGQGSTFRVSFPIRRQT